MLTYRPSAAVVVLALGMAAGSAACNQMSSPIAPTVPAGLSDSPPPAPAPAPQPPPPPLAPTQARYSVVFDSTWSETTHPTDFPDNAHYSGLIGGTHSSAVTFWEVGALASEGIRQMAERGRKSPLDGEVMQAIAAGTAQYVLSGPDLRTSPASTSMEFDITQSFSLVTLVSMVAPSPDWFVGVSRLPLFVNGQWVDEIKVDLYAHDAGTDSGTSYESPDEETVPRRPIAQLTGYPVVSGGQVRPFATFTFKRIQ